MSILKNEVGRPSNETLKTRRILKGLIFVVAIALVFAGGYMLNGNSNNNVDNKKENIIKKYDELPFSRNTKTITGYTFNGSNIENMVDLEVNLYNGIITCLKGEKTSVKVEGINSKVKYIEGYQFQQYAPDELIVLALTEQHELYAGLYYKDSNSLKFELVSENINEMLLTNNVLNLTRPNGSLENRIYVLTNKSELLQVKYDNKNLRFYLSDEKYEDAYLYVGNYHEGFTAYNSIIRLSDNNISFYFDSENFKSLRYNGETLKMKNVYIGSKVENYDYDNIEHYVYIIDENNYLFTTEEKYIGYEANTKCTNCYTLKKVSQSKVKDYKTFIQDEHNFILKVIFEDGSEKEFEYDFTN